MLNIFDVTYNAKLVQGGLRRAIDYLQFPLRTREMPLSRSILHDPMRCIAHVHEFVAEKAGNSRLCSRAVQEFDIIMQIER
jgi:hypothetical protein